MSSRWRSSELSVEETSRPRSGGSRGIEPIASTRFFFRISEALLYVFFVVRSMCLKEWAGIGFAVEKYDVVDVAKSVGIVMGAGALPYDFVGEKILAENFIHHHLYVMPYMPIQMRIHRAAIAQ